MWWDLKEQGLHLVYNQGRTETHRRASCRSHEYYNGSIPQPLRRVNLSYHGGANKGKTLIEAMEKRYDIGTFDMRFPVKESWREEAQRLLAGLGGPVCVYRPASIKRQWRAPARNPDQDAMIEIVRRLRADGWKVISLAYGQGETEYESIVQPEPEVDLRLHGDAELGTTLALMADADLVLTTAGMGQAVGLATGAKTLVVYGGHRPDNVMTDKRMDLSNYHAIIPRRSVFNNRKHGSGDVTLDPDQIDDAMACVGGKRLDTTVSMYVPAGIGDALWSLMSVKSMLATQGADKAVIGIAPGGRQRAKGFVERFTFVKSAHYAAQFGITKTARPRRDGSYNYRDTQPRWNGYDWLAIANGHLERGNRLELWRPQWDTNWGIADDFVFHNKEVADAERFHRDTGDYVVCYMGNIRINSERGHNRGAMWKPEQWAGLMARLAESGVKVVVTGAEYDRSYFEQRVRKHVGKPEWLIDRIGQTDIASTFAMCKRAKCVISYQSGIGIFSVYMGVPVAMWWRPYGNSQAPKRRITFSEDMATAWAPKAAVESGQYLPCIYGRESVDDIVTHAKEHWL